MRIEFGLPRDAANHWEPWFAWRPVKIGRTWFWFERVERKLVWDYCDREWKYRRMYEEK